MGRTKSVTLVKLTVVHQFEILWDRLGQAGTDRTHGGPSHQADDNTVLGVDPDLTRELGNVFFVLGELRDWLTQVNVRLPDGLAGAGDVLVSISLRGAASNKVIIGIR